MNDIKLATPLLFKLLGNIFGATDVHAVQLVQKALTGPRRLHVNQIRRCACQLRSLLSKKNQRGHR
jgi:hypothetical protein